MPVPYVLRKENTKFQLIEELRSLGISPVRINQLNDEKELSYLVENIKQAFVEAYKREYKALRESNC